MNIIDGFNSKPTHIRISAISEGDYPSPVERERMGRIWIEQEGVRHWLLGATLKPPTKGKKYPDYTVVEDEKGNKFVRGKSITLMEGSETLSYATLDELLDLRDEINAVIQELVK